MTLKNLLVLAVALLMFPQLAQTLYSPALGDIGQAFAVGPERAGQTLSVYFLAFALGVVVWGRACDHLGRRPVMLAGLTLYACASVLALSVSTFTGLLLAQALAAFGAAVASVVTQTVLRDRFHGPELAQVFSVVGIAMAASPAIGLFSGAVLVQFFGYRGMLCGLLVLVLLLWGWCVWALPETRPASLPATSMHKTVGLMFKDLGIWCSVGLVAVFNIAVFAYYSVAPFIFAQQGLSSAEFGYSGVLLALGSGLGAWLNKALLKRGMNGDQLVLTAAGIAVLGSLLVLTLQHTGLFVLPMLLVVLAFGMAIPNVLGAALMAYRDRLGTAAAVFGLLYYLAIGGGLTLVAWAQDLGWSLLVCAMAALCLATPRVFRS
ncbi:MFS transporter [Pseudomonas fluorescens]|uniref:MFS transporter n=1 Tax=Pseudomonas lactucae TaxID=2813360 RepID=A0A9X0YBU1_9PSED|nr:MFS transporter [Pseudomonas lactucae]OPA92300.1 MFS transporter [Pseudomonas fluorescens]MBN2976530.1 MFS transporter [Pseudomonas lactucae]MBN2989192.1 MFS transporter [Pseudomonas lactucae]OPB10950.1 MFS transporter [Pseudomonas fluorescens]OPB22597.1 MFS transporter [Pseudomonas fluorescens]